MIVARDGVVLSEAQRSRAELVEARMRLEMAALEYGNRQEPLEQAKFLAAGVSFQRALVAATRSAQAERVAKRTAVGA